MKTLRRKSPVRERGSVAVECAIVLPILLILVSGMLFFGRVFWHYTVAEKAAHDAARFLATTSLRDMKAANGGEVPMAVVAGKIAQEETKELSPGGYVFVTMSCYVGDPDPYWDRCYGVDVPKRVMARVTIQLTDPFLDAFTAEFTNGDPIVLRAVMATDWVGN
jgi:hypothetical protein